MTVGTSFYNLTDGTLFLVLILVMGIGPLLAWRHASWSSIVRNFRWPALLAALLAIILPLAGVTSVLANVAFSVCAFAAATILYELWRGMRVRHGHGEPYTRAALMLVQRHRQRYGGYLVHLGLILLAVGVIGSHFFQTEQDLSLQLGKSASVGGYTVTYRGISGSMQNSVQVIQTHFTISHTGQRLAEVYPGEKIFPGFTGQPTSIVSITTFGLTDVYVFLAGYEGSSSAQLKVFINPMVPLVWLGGLAMLLGGVICWWPGSRPLPAARRLETGRRRRTASEDGAEPTLSARAARAEVRP
jgi:cytochrome c-type biogenesis protein CcmF